MLIEFLLVSLLQQPRTAPAEVDIATETSLQIEDRGIACAAAGPGRREGLLPGQPAQACDLHRWGAEITGSYLYAALRSELEGTVHIEGRVAENGRFTRCNVTRSSGSNLLDNTACKKMEQYARFLPATDEHGHAIEGGYATQIAYRLPSWPPRDRVLLREVEPVNLANWLRRIYENYPSTPLRQDMNGTVKLRVMVAPNGRAVRCEVIQTSNNSITDQSACRGMIRYSRFNPALNSDGDLAIGEYQTSITYAVR